MELTEIWPPFQVMITAGDLELRIVRDDDLPELVELALSGVHDPDQMPFAFPWTQADPADLPANLVRYQWSVRHGFSPERFTLEFAVRRAGELVGCQGYGTHDFAITRTGESGSWLAKKFHGQGIGTRMRRAVCAFAFDELGATEVTSGAFSDNPASNAVSRKLGYQRNGAVRHARGGEIAVNQKWVLTPDTFVRGDEPITSTGAEPLRRFLNLTD